MDFHRQNTLQRIGITLLAALCLTSFGMCEALAKTSDFKLFRERYQCLILSQLTAIQAEPEEDNNFLVLAFVESPNGYMQCRFDSNEPEHLLCEAASGYYDHPDPPKTPFRVSKQGLEDLTRLGFSTDMSHGNFTRTFDLHHDKLADVADMLVSGLYDVYGARADWHLDPSRPMPRAVHATCAPLS